jgi:CubicO group peptidase (beta-lactamase class C family)
MRNLGDVQKNDRLRRIARWRGVRRAVVSAFLLLTLFAGNSCTRQSFESKDSLGVFSAYLDRQIPRLLNRYGVPGVSIALVREGELVWSNAYGYADLEHGRQMKVGRAGSG